MQSLEGDLEGVSNKNNNNNNDNNNNNNDNNNNSSKSGRVSRMSVVVVLVVGRCSSVCRDASREAGNVRLSRAAPRDTPA